MSEINFIDTDAGQILDMVLEELENGVHEPLYGGDERRIFGEAIVPVVVAVYTKVNDACKQKMLRYARGDVLDAIGETRDTYRMESTPATTLLRFSITEAVQNNIIIPEGIRVTNDFTHYFLTDETVVLYAGSLSVDVTATAENGGAEYNEIAAGSINKIVDVSDVPMIDAVTNLDDTAGGGDTEEDEAYRERIREAENRLSTAGPAQAYKYWALSANPLVSDAVVFSEEETITRKLKTYAGHAFQGGSHLLPETLIVYLPDGTEAAEGTVYTAVYDDDLLMLTLTGALSDAAEVDISITRTMEGCVKIVPICAGGEIPDEDVLADVLAACTAPDVKPLTDRVTVEAPSVEMYDIELTYYTTRANQSEVVQNVEGSGGAIDQYIYWQGSNLSQDINPDELRRRILVPNWADGLTGASRVDIIKPEYTKLPKTTVAKFSGNMKVSHVVTG